MPIGSEPTNSLPTLAAGPGWRSDFVFNRDNLVLDLLHDFSLEDGACTIKLRVCEMTNNPAACHRVGSLCSRAAACMPTLAQLTGVDVKRMFPILNLEGADILESHPSWPKACTASA